MNCEKEPSEYEFNRLVFGINSSPFLAKFVSNIMSSFMNRVTLGQLK